MRNFEKWSLQTVSISSVDLIPLVLLVQSSMQSIQTDFILSVLLIDVCFLFPTHIKLMNKDENIEIIKILS